MENKRKNTILSFFQKKKTKSNEEKNTENTEVRMIQLDLLNI